MKRSVENILETATWQLAKLPRYVTPAGLVLFTGPRIGRNPQWGTFCRRSSGGGTHRVKSPQLPMRDTAPEAAADLAEYAAGKEYLTEETTAEEAAETLEPAEPARSEAVTTTLERRKPNSKGSTKAKVQRRDWSRAKIVQVPIAKTGATFRQYPNYPPRPCEVTASIRVLATDDGWAWQYELDSPLSFDGDPSFETRKEAPTEELAISRAIVKIRESLEQEIDIRRHHEQSDIEAACVHALRHVQIFSEEHMAKKASRQGAKARSAKKVRGQSSVVSGNGQRTTDNGQRTPGTALVPATPAKAEVVDVPKPLSAVERKSLAHHEKTIETGRHVFVDVGTALAAIREQRLYRAEHETFEQYCRARWNFGKAEAYDKIRAAEVYAIVSPISDRAGVKLVEDHLKALAPLKDDGDIKSVFSAAVKTAKKDGVPVTGKLLRAERRRDEGADDSPQASSGDRAMSGVPPRKAPSGGEDLDYQTSGNYGQVMTILEMNINVIADRYRNREQREELISTLDRAAERLSGELTKAASKRKAR